MTRGGPPEPRGVEDWAQEEREGRSEEGVEASFSLICVNTIWLTGVLADFLGFLSVCLLEDLENSAGSFSLDLVCFLGVQKLILFNNDYGIQQVASLLSFLDPVSVA